MVILSRLVCCEFYVTVINIEKVSLLHTSFTTIYQSTLLTICKIFMGRSEFYVYSIAHSINRHLSCICYVPGTRLVVGIQWQMSLLVEKAITEQVIPSKSYGVSEVGCNSTLVSLNYVSLPSVRVYSGNTESLIIGSHHVCLVIIESRSVVSNSLPPHGLYTVHGIL